MKIVLVTHSFFPNSVGGREKHVYDLANALSKAGHEVEIFTCSDSPFKKYTDIKNSFRIHYLQTIRLPFSVGYYRIPPSLFLELAKVKADIIHSHDFHHFTTLISAIASKRAQTPFLLTEHGYSEQIGVTKLLIKFYDNLFLPQIRKSLTKAIAVSNFIREELIHRYKVSEDRIEVIHNFINLKSYKVKSSIFRKKYGLEDKKIILASGRLIREKGFQYLIRAFPHVIKKTPETILAIIGPTNYYKNELIKLSESKKLTGKVIFCGTVSEEMLKSALFCSDIVAIPSLYEPFGIIALEAMAYAKPIIASNTGGLAETLTNKRNGLLVTPGNVTELAGSIIGLLNNKSFAKRLGRKAQKDVKSYDWEKNIEKIVNIYQKCASD